MNGPLLSVLFTVAAGVLVALSSEPGATPRGRLLDRGLAGVLVLLAGVWLLIF